MIISIVFLVVLCIIIAGMSLFLFNMGNFSVNSAFAPEEVDSLPYVFPAPKSKLEHVAVVRSNNEEVEQHLLSKSNQTDCHVFHNIYDTKSFPVKRCSGHGSCVIACPQKAISIDDNCAVISHLCNGCGICIDVCPRKILELIPSDSEENTIKINLIKNRNSFKFWKFWYNILYKTKENGKK